MKPVKKSRKSSFPDRDAETASCEEEEQPGQERKIVSRKKGISFNANGKKPFCLKKEIWQQLLIKAGRADHSLRDGIGDQKQKEENSEKNQRADSVKQRTKQPKEDHTGAETVQDTEINGKLGHKQHGDKGHSHPEQKTESAAF